ncbi:MAG TPA: LysM peptidoglycan-binding domain-containing protein [Anaeromyxobacteraceae bacterium]
MHNATTKQRRAALRRHLGIFLGSLPSWIRRRRARAPAPLSGAERLEDLGAADTAATGPAMTPAPPPGASFQAGQTLVAPPDGAFAFMAATTAPLVQRSTPAGSWAACGPMPARTPAPGPPRASAPDRERGPRPRRRAAAAVAVVALAAALAALALARRGPASASASVAAGKEGGEPLAARALSAAAAPSPAAARGAGPQPGEHRPAISAGHPASPATAARTVVVRRGDTLWDLCAHHLGDPYAWPRIHALNRDRVANPDLIFPGQEIRIPGT